MFVMMVEVIIFEMLVFNVLFKIKEFGLFLFINFWVIFVVVGI